MLKAKKVSAAFDAADGNTSALWDERPVRGVARIRKPFSRPINLRRYLSLPSFVATVVVMLMLVGIDYQSVKRNYWNNASSKSIATASILSRALYNDYYDLLVRQDESDLLPERAADSWPKIREIVGEYLGPMDIVDLKIYDRSEMVVFSMVPDRVGSTHQGGAALQRAFYGKTFSRLTEPDLNSYQSHSAVVETYVPIRDRVTYRVIGAFEVYVDISSELSHAKRRLLQHTAIVIALLGVLFCTLYYIAWRADYVISERDQRLDRRFAVLRRARNDLKQRVQERTRALRDSEDKFRGIAASASDAVILMDQDGLVGYWNSAAETMFGYSHSEANGRPLHDLIAPERYRSAFEKGLTSFRNSGKGRVVGHVVELCALNRAGDEFPVELSVSALNLSQQRCAVAIVRDATTRKNNERELIEQQELLRSVLDNTDNGLLAVDEEHRIVFCNRRFLDIWQMDTEFIDTHPTLDDAYGVLCDRGTLIKGEWFERRMRMIETANPKQVFQFERQDGVIVESNVAPLPGIGKLLLYRDITKTTRTKNELRDQATLLQSVVQNSDNALLALDHDNRAIFYNRKFVEFARVDTSFLDSRPSIEDFMREFAKQGVYSADRIDQRIAERLQQIAIADPEDTFLLPREDGVVTEAFATRLEGIGTLLVYRDVTERRRYENDLIHLANHDPLTGLPNRNLIRDRVDQAIAHAHRDSKMVAVFFIDLDQFKLINDNLGHDTGDLLLKTVAERLRRSVPDGDIVGRHGGDEFVVMITGLVEEKGAAVTARKILRRVKEPMVIHGHELDITCSIGISLYPRDGQSVEMLFRHCDMAMYRAKEAGRNYFHFFTKDMDAGLSDKILLATALRSATTEGQLVLHYQPQYDFVTGRMTGAEALVRWQHPKLGLLAPDRFIPIAEEIGLVGTIGKWVLATAIRQNQVWRQSGMTSVPISVNISARQFRQQNLIPIIDKILEESGMAPEYLDVEITETMIMEDPKRTINVLERLKERGVKISLDDFGTGYSSLAYLKQFPLDRIKIDRSFIKGIPENSDDVLLLEAIITLARGLGYTTIAEGVETEAQWEYLRQHDCDQVQGFFTGHPLPAEAFEQTYFTNPVDDSDLCREGLRPVI